VTPPRKGVFRLIGEVLDHGGPGYLQFAITNICNAKCDFCGFAVDRFDPKLRRSVTLKEAQDVIDICVKNYIGYLLFVGGEPLVHKDLRAMTRYAAERGVQPKIPTLQRALVRLGLTRKRKRSSPPSARATRRASSAGTSSASDSRSSSSSTPSCARAATSSSSTR